MSASKEVVRDRIDELSNLIAEAASKGDLESVNQLKNERSGLTRKLTEMNEKTGSILTDSPMNRPILKG